MCSFLRIVIEILQRILKLSGEKEKAAMSMENRVKEMNKLAFGDGNLEQRTTVCLLLFLIYSRCKPDIEDHVLAFNSLYLKWCDS